MPCREKPHSTGNALQHTKAPGSARPFGRSIHAAQPLRQTWREGRRSKHPISHGSKGKALPFAKKKKGKKACVSPNDMRLPPCPRAYNRRPSPIDDMGWDMYGNHAFVLWQPPGIKEQHRDKQGQGPLLRLDDIPRNQPITQAKRGRKPQLCPA